MEATCFLQKNFCNCTNIDYWIPRADEALLEIWLYSPIQWPSIVLLYRCENNIEMLDDMRWDDIKRIIWNWLDDNINKRKAASGKLFPCKCTQSKKEDKLTLRFLFSRGNIVRHFWCW